MAGSGAETHRKIGRKVRKTGYAPRAPRQTASKIVPPALPFCTISRTGNYERSRAAHNKKPWICNFYEKMEENLYLIWMAVKSHTTKVACFHTRFSGAWTR